MNEETLPQSGDAGGGAEPEDKAVMGCVSLKELLIFKEQPLRTD